MVGYPGAVQNFGRVMQRVLREAILLAQRAEGTGAFQLLGAGDGTRCLPGGVSAHVPQTPLAFRQDRIIELASRFQMGTQAFRLSGADLKW
jgi:hypothetical protein